MVHKFYCTSFYWSSRLLLCLFSRWMPTKTMFFQTFQFRASLFSRWDCIRTCN